MGQSAHIRDFDTIISSWTSKLARYRIH